MAIEANYEKLEDFKAEIADKNRQWTVMFKMMDNFSGDGTAWAARKQEQTIERQRLKDEIVTLAAESLATLGYDAVMQNLESGMSAGNSLYRFSKEEFLESILKYVTEKKLIAARPASESPAAKPDIAVASHDAVQAALTKEPKKDFDECIEIDKPMTPQEAIQQLATFHNRREETILSAFPNLKNLDGATTVSFTKTVNQSTGCISMEGWRADGSRTWNSYINRFTGQPMNHAS